MHLFSHVQCLLLYLKLGDSHREGKVLYTIGLLASSAALDDRRTGYNYLAQARVIFRRRGDTADEGDACYALGKSCVRNGAFEQAVKYFEEVRWAPSRPAVSETLLKGCTDAAACCRRAQASSLFHSAHLPVDEAWASYRLALVMLKVRSASLAISYLVDARQLFAEAPSDERHAEGSCCLRIAEILSGAVGGKEGGVDVKDDVRAAEFFDEVRRVVPSFALARWGAVLTRSWTCRLRASSPPTTRPPPRQPLLRARRPLRLARAPSRASTARPQPRRPRRSRPPARRLCCVAAAR